MIVNKQLGVSASLLILPGLLCDSRLFAAQLDRFPHARIVDGFYGGASRIEDMADYALARAPERFALLGHSMGARVALEIVRRAADRVERLALADTGIHTIREGEREKRYRLLELGRAEGIAALVDAWLPGMVHVEDPALVATLRAMCIDAGVDTYAAQIEALLGRPSVDDLLPRISCPTLVVCGAEDRWSPPVQHAAIVAAIPGACLRVIAGAGHMAPAEAPQGFNAILAEWLGWPATPSHSTQDDETRKAPA